MDKVEDAISKRKIADKGICPDCGKALEFNNHLAGTNWYQCEDYARCHYQILWKMTGGENNRSGH